ncbi:hypothetical protein PVAR5_8901 [Paecilomyces variotii No. 5]|uniref:Uncharacterized protein n=1 Tax=Byssochlamys spectabilis (strain No. 5 / NBRC 109023) TaxID=1356009 RepID=V5FQ15_BYSSN|nr:hypothetical protein PVAR5_8901 [Paecilomyces variotii No. 5]
MEKSDIVTSYTRAHTALRAVWHQHGSTTLISSKVQYYVYSEKAKRLEQNLAYGVQSSLPVNPTGPQTIAYRRFVFLDSVDHFKVGRSALQSSLIPRDIQGPRRDHTVTLPQDWCTNWI